MTIFLACVIAGQFPIGGQVPVGSAVVQDISEVQTTQTTCEKIGAHDSGAFNLISQKYVKCDHDTWSHFVNFYCAKFDGKTHIAMMTAGVGK